MSVSAPKSSAANSKSSFMNSGDINSFFKNKNNLEIFNTTNHHLKMKSGIPAIHLPNNNVVISNDPSPTNSDSVIESKGMSHSHNHSHSQVTETFGRKHFKP